MGPSFSIGIDLGGTNIKAVAVDETGQVLQRQTRPTRDGTAQVSSWVETIREFISDFEADHGSVVSNIGLAIPGIVAPDSRSVAWCPGKLSGIEGVDWGDALGRKQIVPLLNDAHAALIGEHWLGAARPFRDAILLTLGTGVGGAILSEGRLLRGAHGRAGILGFMSLDPFGPGSAFSVPAPLEHWIGDLTVASRSGGKFASTEQLVQAVRRSDPDAEAVWRKSIRALAVAIVSYKLILDIEAVIIGGGIAQAGLELFGPLTQELDQLEWRPANQKLQILPAALGAWSGAIGAAKNAMTFQSHQ